MIVTKIDDNHYNVLLNPRDLEALEADIRNPPDWGVINIASLIRYLLSLEVERNVTRYDIC